MTISKEAWIQVENIMGIEHILPNERNMNVPEELLKKVGIGLYIHDIMADLYSASVSQWVDQHTGMIHTITCQGFVKSFFHQVIDMLVTTCVKRYIICFDPIGNARPEKAATAAKRAHARKQSEARGEPERIELPDGEFTVDMTCPSSIRLIMKNLDTKRLFYQFMIQYLTSDFFRSQIPEGKVVIVSGGWAEGRMCDPIFITPSEVVEVHALSFPTMSEGDLDVWRWTFVFPEDDFQIYSCDGDPFLIGLMVMRNLVKVSPPTRRGWFITSRGAGQVEDFQPHPKMIELKKRKAELLGEALLSGYSPQESFQLSGGALLPASSSSSSSESEFRQPIHWLKRYVDMFGCYRDILTEARDSEISNPVELFVLCLILSSKTHDYVNCSQFTPQVGASFIFLAYATHMRALPTLVQVAKADDNPSKHIYVIDVEQMIQFALYCYEEKAKDAVKFSKTNNTQAKVTQAQHKKFRDLIDKFVEPPERKQMIETIAAQCVWTLQYWANGVHSDIEIQNGLVEEEKEGKSIFGFHSSGWTNQVFNQNKRICPLNV